MTTSESKKLVKGWLAELGLPALPLKARTSYSPFSGVPRVFVTVGDWHPDPKATTLQARGVVHGFSVHFTPAEGETFVSHSSSDPKDPHNVALRQAIDEYRRTSCW